MHAVLRYLKGTLTTGLPFTRSDLVLKFYSDASHLQHADGRGHTGFLAKLGNTIVMSRSGKQKIQARSSTEAEIIAAEECATYLVYMRKLCEELGIPTDGPTTIAQDNKSAIIIVNQGGTFKRTKHMVGRISYLKQCIDDRNATMVYTSTRDMLADMLTKPLSREVIKRHNRALGVFPDNNDIGK
jgi:hypothetical protein